MDEKNKKILSGFLEVAGYGSAIGYTSLMTWFVYQVHKHGIIKLIEPNIYIRLAEIGLGSATIAFLVYKFSQSLKKRQKELIEIALK